MFSVADSVKALSRFNDEVKLRNATKGTPWSFGLYSDTDSRITGKRLKLDTRQGMWKHEL